MDIKSCSNTSDMHHALITLVNKITQSLDSDFPRSKKKHLTQLIPNFLLFFYSYGIRGQLINWFKSYLENGSYNEKKSDIRNVICGVPQGSILRPLLFLIYIRDFVSFSGKLYYVLFADDTNVFSLGNNLRRLINTFNLELDKLYV